MNNATDTITKLKARDEHAYSELWQQSHPRLFAVAYRILRDAQEADDAVQDAFLSLVRNVGRFRGEASIQTWLYSVVCNAARMRRRKQKRAPLPIPHERPRPDTPVAESSSCPTTQAARNDTAALVRERIEALDPTHREILNLRAFEQLTTEESARRLGISRTAARGRYFRARAALRKALERQLAVAQLPS